MVRHLNVSLQDHIHLFNQSVLNSVLEGVKAGNHFKHDQAETVPVYRISVVFVFYNFGSQILSGTTKALSQIIMLFKAAFAQTEIGESDVSLGIDQDVFGLNISVNYSLGMKVLKGEDNFGHVELCALFGKLACKLEMVEQLASVDEFHDEIKIHVVLERKLKLHHKWMIELFQDLSLS